MDKIDTTMITTIFVIIMACFFASVLRRLYIGGSNDLHGLERHDDQPSG
jgi:hypothetical protein